MELSRKMYTMFWSMKRKMPSRNNSVPQMRFGVEEGWGGRAVTL